MVHRTKLAVTVALVVAFPLACGDDSTTGSGATGGSGASTETGGAGAGGGATGGGAIGGGVTGGGATGGGANGGANQGGSPPMQIALCGNHPQPYECGDLIDNDNDGLVDSDDPDCLGPCDNTEDSYFGGIPGQANPPCKQDCYWDPNSGSGNDDCYWDHRCDPHEVDPGYYPEPNNGAQCEYDPQTQVTSSLDCNEALSNQSDTCLANCGPLTPNGCDCFGCCELPAGSGKFVWLGSVGADGDTVCTQAEINNPDVCHPCIQVPGCANDCKPCEICIGKPEPEPGCDGTGGGGGGGGSSQCADGIQPCGLPGQDPCAFGYYCITGCCQMKPPG